MKFALKLFLFVALSTGIFSGLYWYYPINQKELDRNEYLLAVEDKTIGVKKLEGKRLIFIGGSSVAFGIDSKTIGDSLGYQGFNLGLTTMVGPEFMVDQAIALARPGDVVVLSAEYYLPPGVTSILDFLYHKCPEIRPFSKKPKEDESLGRWYETQSNRLLQWTDRIQLVWLRGVAKVKHADSTSFYKRYGFNDRGDYIAHLTQDFDKSLFKSNIVQQIPFEAQMKSFNKLAGLNQKGIQVFYLYPCFSKEDYQANETPILRYKALLEKELQMPILGSPAEFQYPQNTFFDNCYHIKNPGREQRTNQVIQILKQALQGDTTNT